MTHSQSQPHAPEKNGADTPDSGSESPAKPAPASASASARRGGLGRGLSALIPGIGQAAQRPPHAPAQPASDDESPKPAPADNAAATATSVPTSFLDQMPFRSQAAAEPHHAGSQEKLRVIPLRAISLNPQQPRKEFKREELDDLTASIKEHGILQPIAVRVKPGSGSNPAYELIAGERRFRAASAAGLGEVPALVKEDVSDRESLALAIIENVQREDLNVIEAAQGYDELLHAYNMTQTELAQSIGKSQPQIANALRMLNLPAPIQDSLRAAAISEGHAKVILSLKTEPEQTALWSEIVSQGLTVRVAEKRAAALRAAPNAAAPRPAPVRTPPAGDPHLAEISQKISLNMGTKVRLVPGKGQRGVIEISYFDHDQLEDLLDKLNAGA